MWGVYESDWIYEASSDEGDETKVMDGLNYFTDTVPFFLDAGN
jgi:hypothetical protein